MRSNHNVDDSTQRGAARKLRMTAMPVEWLQTGSWRLPSGKALAEFALQAGFLAPLLFRAEQFGSSPAGCGNPGSLKAARMRSESKHLGEGSSR